VYRTALGLDADLYHFHDPELMPIGVRLKMHGRKVVYDVHEEVSNDILDKDWISPYVRPALARGVGLFEKMCALFYDGIVITRPALDKGFSRRKTVLVHNYPILGELMLPASVPYRERPPIVAYVGGGTPERGIREMVLALERLPPDSPLELHFAGTVHPETFLDELRAMPGWARVRYLGWQSRAQVAELLGKARMGIVMFLPIANHLESEPTKLFEYMSAKLPVVASNIPHWEEMVRGQGYARLADPADADAVARAMLDLLNDPAEAEAMGVRGYESVLSRYNWDVACANLAQLYRRILD
jgi:glycosyltransferase involved in cell wall biosynthesis